MRLADPPERGMSEAVYYKSREVLHLTAFGTRNRNDECVLWEVDDPFRGNQVVQMMVHYDEWVHGVSIEMMRGLRKTLGQHLG